MCEGWGGGELVCSMFWCPYVVWGCGMLTWGSGWHYMKEYGCYVNGHYTDNRCTLGE